MVAESGKLSKSGLGIGGNGCFGAAISKPLMAEIGPSAALCLAHTGHSLGVCRTVGKRATTSAFDPLPPVVNDRYGEIIRRLNFNPPSWRTVLLSVQL